MQIVLIEDNAPDVILVRMALQEAGLDVSIRVIADGVQAISFIEAADEDPSMQPIDLLLLDMNLPCRDGEDILKRLRSTERHAQTPVVVMTSSSAPADRAKAEKHAAMHYFQKPATLDEFMQLGVIARDILDRKKTPESAAVRERDGDA